MTWRIDQHLIVPAMLSALVAWILFVVPLVYGGYAAYTSNISRMILAVPAFLIFVFAFWPRNDAERLARQLSPGIGVHRSNLRILLCDPFAFLLSRRTRRSPKPYLGVALLFGAFALLGVGLALTAFFYWTASAVSLRRAAWAGSHLALQIERKVLGMRYPTVRSMVAAELANRALRR